MSDTPEANGSPHLQRNDPLAEQAYRALREQIATGTLGAGQRITERALAETLGVSPTPVREALRRLEQEGLVERSAVRALTVANHSDQALRELMFAGIVLRAAEARFAAQKINDDQIRTLESIVSEMAERAESATEAELLALAGQFDGVVTEAAANPGLRRLIENTLVVGRARRLEAVEVMRGPSRQIGRRHLQAHVDLVAALRDHDADRAEQVLRSHLLSALDLLLGS